MPRIDDNTFKFAVLILLAAIFWVIVTDYHFETPQQQTKPEPMTSQEKAVFVWAFYIIGMIGAWAMFLLHYYETLEDRFKKHEGEK